MISRLVTSSLLFCTLALPAAAQDAIIRINGLAPSSRAVLHLYATPSVKDTVPSHTISRSELEFPMRAKNSDTRFLHLSLSQGRSGWARKSELRIDKAAPSECIAIGSSDINTYGPLGASSSLCQEGKPR